MKLFYVNYRLPPYQRDLSVPIYAKSLGDAVASLVRCNPHAIVFGYPVVQAEVEVVCDCEEFA